MENLNVITQAVVFIKMPEKILKKFSPFNHDKINLYFRKYLTKSEIVDFVFNPINLATPEDEPEIFLIKVVGDYDRISLTQFLCRIPGFRKVDNIYYKNEIDN